MDSGEDQHDRQRRHHSTTFNPTSQTHRLPSPTVPTLTPSGLAGLISVSRGITDTVHLPIGGRSRGICRPCTFRARDRGEDKRPGCAHPSASRFESKFLIVESRGREVVVDRGTSAQNQTEGTQSFPSWLSQIAAGSVEGRQNTRAQRRCRTNQFRGIALA